MTISVICLFSMNLCERIFLLLYCNRGFLAFFAIRIHYWPSSSSLYVSVTQYSPIPAATEIIIADSVAAYHVTRRSAIGDRRKSNEYLWNQRVLFLWKKIVVYSCDERCWVCYYCNKILWDLYGIRFVLCFATSLVIVWGFRERRSSPRNLQIHKPKGRMNYRGSTR